MRTVCWQLELRCSLGFSGEFLEIKGVLGAEPSVCPGRDPGPKVAGLLEKCSARAFREHVPLCEEELSRPACGQKTARNCLHKSNVG